MKKQDIKKFIRKATNYIIDMTRKKKIFERARECGSDWDGDLILYEGIKYYINISTNVLRRVEEK